MYEVFINHNRLVFDSNISDKNYTESWEKMYFQNLNIAPKDILFMMADANFCRDVVIFSEDEKKTRKAFFTGIKKIAAAGGLVINKKGQFLFIFRNGKWDLPKGKIEKDEKAELAAIREVQEETGIDHIDIKKLLHTTFHFYIQNNKPIIKKTFWYEMVTGSSKKLKPQIEEGITRVEWIGKSDMGKCLKNTYRLIGNLMERYFIKER